MKEKLIYYFNRNKSEGNAEMRALLGTKGANLAEMCKVDIPVPPGFIISTSAYKNYFNSSSNKLSIHLLSEIREYLRILEEDSGFKFGSINSPLLVSVRSGSVSSMPGMLDTVLNVGLNDETIIGLAKKNGDSFAYDSYCRFIKMYSSVVLHLDHHIFQNIIDNEKQKNGANSLIDLNLHVLKRIIKDFKKMVYEKTKKDFPQNVEEQLLSSISAVFSSWKNSRAISYRKMNNIPDITGTAVIIQSMVFGNLNNNSAAGVIFTRDPSNGRKSFFGEFLINAQGEDIVSGIHTPIEVNGDKDNTMEKLMPSVYQYLCSVCEKLEIHYKDMQDIEFTVQDGDLWILQTRSGKRTARAAVQIVVDMVNEGLITKEEGILRIDSKTLDDLLHPILEIKGDQKVIGKGLPASPGVASGHVIFSTSDAKKIINQGKKMILVRSETSPEDIHIMDAVSGIITARGGMTSHAAVITRGMGKPCICSVGELYIDKNKNFFSIGDIKVNKGESITINGSTGEVILGVLPTISHKLSQEFKTITSWIDKFKTISVRANADTIKDIKIASEFGAEGIGLCRTEHMFFTNDRIEFIQRLIIADNKLERTSALIELEQMQKSDFKEIFSIMNGNKITIRLLDLPLHEFLPNDQFTVEKIAKSLNKSIEMIKNKIAKLSERNPMLGHRGCRLAISYPEIYSMQIRAILSAANEIKKKKKIEIKPEIMIPFIVDEKELISILNLIEKESFFASKRKSYNSYSIGIMIELPRAAIIANKLAEHVDFFSFGTNDLTQTTMGLSRDDSANFFDSYKRNNIFMNDPFEVLDVEGVGELVKIAIEKSRKAKKEIKIGVCGEHGADPKSVKFLIKSGIDYISCSPYRVPVAKLLAAHFAIALKNNSALI